MFSQNVRIRYRSLHSVPSLKLARHGTASVGSTLVRTRFSGFSWLLHQHTQKTVGLWVGQWGFGVVAPLGRGPLFSTQEVWPLISRGLLKSQDLPRNRARGFSKAFSTTPEQPRTFGVTSSWVACSSCSSLRSSPNQKRNCRSPSKPQNRIDQQFPPKISRTHSTALANSLRLRKSHKFFQPCRHPKNTPLNKNLKHHLMFLCFSHRGFFS